MPNFLEAHEKWFEDFARYKIAGCTRDAMPLHLKLEHTRQVLNNAQRMAEGENLSPEMRRICLLGALYHDVSRFDQYLQYGTFKDRDSCNHGLLSVKILKAENRMKGLPRAERHAIFTAVGLHNRFALPPGLPSRTMLACEVVRASDKLDILRVMDEHLSAPGPYNPTVVLSLPNDPQLHGEKVDQLILARKAASYNDLLSVNDFRLLLGSWFFDLKLESARKLFVTEGHAERLLMPIDPYGPHGKVRNFLLNIFENYKKTIGRQL